MSTEDESFTPSDPTSMEDLVDGIIGEIKDVLVKCNPERTLAVVDLASRNSDQGIQYRQLYVALKPYGLDVDFREGFKSLHGGMDQMKVLEKFSIPLVETIPYTKMYTRFFNYRSKVEITNGGRLLRELKGTRI